MINKECQEKLLKVHETREAMDKLVLSCFLDTALPDEEILKLRKQYIKFYAEAGRVEARLGKSQRASLEQWLTMWKEQSNENE